MRLADIYAVIAYYLNNQPAVQAYLQRQKEETRKLWEQIESKADYQGFRQRLIARRQESRNRI